MRARESRAILAVPNRPEPRNAPSLPVTSTLRSTAPKRFYQSREVYSFHRRASPIAHHPSYPPRCVLNFIRPYPILYLTYF
jgi:hypothetical protein